MDRKKVLFFYIVINFIILCLVYLSLIKFKPFWDTQLRTSNLLLIIIIINSIILLREYYFGEDYKQEKCKFEESSKSFNQVKIAKLSDFLTKNWKNVLIELKKAFVLTNFEKIDSIIEHLKILSNYSGSIAYLLLKLEENGSCNVLLSYGSVPNYILNMRVYIKDGDLIFEYPSNIGKELIPKFEDEFTPIFFSSGLFQNNLFVYPLDLVHGKKGLLLEVVDTGKIEGRYKNLVKFFRSFIMVYIEYITNIYLLSLQYKEVGKYDAQTGFVKYEYIFENLDNEIERSERYGQNITLMLFRIRGEVDSLEEKEFCDARKVLVKAIQTSLRRIDIMLCGKSDKDFIAILTEANVEIAKLIAQRVLNSFEKYKNQFGNEIKPITLHIGSATYPVNATCATNLLNMAEEALEEAVRNNKDYVQYQDLFKIKS